LAELPCWDPEPKVDYPGFVLGLGIDRWGAVVISTDQGGLLRWDRTSWAPLAGSGDGPESATNLAFAPDGSVWALADEDLYMLADGKWTTIPAPPFTTSPAARFSIAPSPRPRHAPGTGRGASAMAKSPAA